MEEDRQSIVEVAKLILQVRGRVIPTLVVGGTNGDIGQALTEVPGDIEAFASVFFQTGVSIRHSKPVGKLKQVHFVTEGWLVRHEHGECFSRPGTDPKPIKVLIVGSLDVERNIDKVTALELVRDGQGALIGIKDSVKDASVRSPLLTAIVAGYSRG